MAVSAADLKAALPVSVGDTGIVAANLDTLWDMFGDKAAVDVRLQFAYARLEALKWREAEVANKVNVRIGGMTVDYASMARAIEGMKAEALAAVASFEGASTSSMPASQQIARVAPVQSSDTYAVGPISDANDLGIQGNPYFGNYPIR
jgi:hypothetical protein